MTRIFGYARVSTADQATADRSSLDDQERRVRGTAMQRGAEITEMFIDPGVSGSIPLNDRPAGQRMMEQIQPGDIIIAAKLDRLFRSASDALVTVERLKANGVGVILADMGSDPVTENGASKLFFSMLAAFAEFERSRITERMAEGRKAKIRRGGHVGGSPPYGWHSVGEGRSSRLESNDREQAILAIIKQTHEEGLSLRRICEHLESLGFRSRSGRAFVPTQIHRILSRPEAAQ